MLRGILIALGSLALACSEEVISPEEAASMVRGAAVPAAQQEGARIYRAHCARCHGLDGEGSDQGPPMLHPYQARHHSDFAFRRAIDEGVRPHHYPLGSMPPVPELTEENVDAVVGYIRWMQRTAGLR